MSSGDDNVQVIFGAQNSDLLKGVKEAQSAVEGAVSGMTGAVGKLNGVFNGLFGQLTSIIGLLAGGAAFKEFIDDTNRINTEATRLAQSLGITGEAAGTLRLALGEARIEVDEYIGVQQRFSRQLKNNEQGLVDLGVKTRDGSGALRNQADIFNESIRILAQYKQGTDRNQVAMQLFGSRVGDVSKFLKLTDEAMERARLKAEALNLTITVEGLAASKAYKLAMNEVKDVTDGVSRTIGEAFLPAQTELLKGFAELGPQIVTGTRILIDVFRDAKDQLVYIFTDIGEGWSIVLYGIQSSLGLLSDRGPSALQIFGNALRIIPGLLIVFRIGFEEVANVVVTGTAVMALGLKTLAEITFKSLTLDYKGAIQSWRAGLAAINGEIQAGIDRAKTIALKGRADIDKTLTQPLGVKPAATAAGFVGDQGDKNAEEIRAKRIALAKAEAQQRVQIANAELAAYKEHLKEEESALQDEFKNNLIGIKSYYAQKLTLAEKEIDEELKTKKVALAAAQVAEASAGIDKAKQVEAATQIKVINIELIALEQKRKDITAANLRERADAEKKLRNELETTRSKLAEDLGTKQLEAEEAAVKQRRALLQITAQEELAALKDLEEKKYQLAYKGAMERIALETDPKRRAEMYADIERAYAAHVGRLMDLDRQMELDRKKGAIEAQAAIEGSFSTFIQSVANGTATLKKAWLSLISSVQQAIIKLMADKIVQQFMGLGTGNGGTIGSLLGAFLGAIGFAGAGAGTGGATQLSGPGSGYTPPGLAGGGDVYPGTPYMVGERGPEMFVPKSSGTIVPNGQGTTVNVRNNFTVNGQMDQRTQAQIASLTGIAVQRAMQRNA